jgi:hypothetical protein
LGEAGEKALILQITQLLRLAREEEEIDVALSLDGSLVSRCDSVYATLLAAFLQELVSSATTFAQVHPISRRSEAN